MVRDFFDALRTSAPSDHMAWPDLLKEMGWDVERIDVNPDWGAPSFFIIDDSGAEIPVLFSTFMWAGGDDDNLANDFFAMAESLSGHSGRDVLILNKIILIDQFEDKEDAPCFSLCGRFFMDGKWSDIYLNKHQDVNTLYKQARSAENEPPDLSLVDEGGYVCKYICQRQGKAMSGL